MNAKMLYLFKSTRDVIGAEKIIRGQGIAVAIIPVPRSVSSECGMCIETERRNEGMIDQALEQTSIVTEKCHEYVK